MSKAIVVGLALLLGFSVGFVGCGGDDGGATAAKGGTATAKPAKATQDKAVVRIGEGGKAVAAKTPMEAWLNFNEAAYTADKALMLSSFHAPEEVKEAIAMGAMSVAGLHILRRELAAAYGEKALEGLFKDVDTKPFDRKGLEASTKIEVEGDKAVAHLANGNVTGLVKKSDAWLVDMSKEEVPTADKIKEMMQFDIARVYAINAVRPKIGTKAYPKVEDILQLMQTAQEARLKAAK